MSSEIKQETVKSKKESRMQLICSITAMVLMVIIIIVLITASFTGDGIIANSPWAWISAAVFGGLLIIDIVVFIILKVQFKKQRNIKEIKTEETIIVEEQHEQND